MDMLTSSSKKCRFYFASSFIVSFIFLFVIVVGCSDTSHENNFLLDQESSLLQPAKEPKSPNIDCTAVIGKSSEDCGLNQYCEKKDNLEGDMGAGICRDAKLENAPCTETIECGKGLICGYQDLRSMKPKSESKKCRQRAEIGENCLYDFQCKGENPICAQPKGTPSWKLWVASVCQSKQQAK